MKKYVGGYALLAMMASTALIQGAQTEYGTIAIETDIADAPIFAAVARLENGIPSLNSGIEQINTTAPGAGTLRFPIDAMCIVLISDNKASLEAVRSTPPSSLKDVHVPFTGIPRDCPGIVSFKVFKSRNNTLKIKFNRCMRTR